MVRRVQYHFEDEEEEEEDNIAKSETSNGSKGGYARQISRNAKGKRKVPKWTASRRAKPPKLCGELQKALAKRADDLSWLKRFGGKHKELKPFHIFCLFVFFMAACVAGSGQGLVLVASSTTVMGGNGSHCNGPVVAGVSTLAGLAAALLTLAFASALGSLPVYPLAAAGGCAWWAAGAHPATAAGGGGGGAAGPRGDLCWAAAAGGAAAAGAFAMDPVLVVALGLELALGPALWLTLLLRRRRRRRPAAAAAACGGVLSPNRPEDDRYSNISRAKSEEEFAVAKILEAPIEGFQNETKEENPKATEYQPEKQLLPKQPAQKKPAPPRYSSSGGASSLSPGAASGVRPVLGSLNGLFSSGATTPTPKRPPPAAAAAAAACPPALLPPPPPPPPAPSSAPARRHGWGRAWARDRAAHYTLGYAWLRRRARLGAREVAALAAGQAAGTALAAAVAVHWGGLAGRGGGAAAAAAAAALVPVAAAAAVLAAGWRRRRRRSSSDAQGLVELPTTKETDYSTSKAYIFLRFLWSSYLIACAVGTAWIASGFDLQGRRRWARAAGAGWALGALGAEPLLGPALALEAALLPPRRALGALARALAEPAPPPGGGGCGARWRRRCRRHAGPLRAVLLGGPRRRRRRRRPARAARALLAAATLAGLALVSFLIAKLDYLVWNETPLILFLLSGATTALVALAFATLSGLLLVSDVPFYVLVYLIASVLVVAIGASEQNAQERRGWLAVLLAALPCLLLAAEAPLLLLAPLFAAKDLLLLPARRCRRRLARAAAAAAAGPFPAPSAWAEPPPPEEPAGVQGRGGGKNDKSLSRAAAPVPPERKDGARGERGEGAAAGARCGAGGGGTAAGEEGGTAARQAPGSSLAPPEEAERKGEVLTGSAAVFGEGGGACGEEAGTEVEAFHSDNARASPVAPAERSPDQLLQASQAQQSPAAPQEQVRVESFESSSLALESVPCAPRSEEQAGEPLGSEEDKASIAGELDVPASKHGSEGNGNKLQSDSQQRALMTCLLCREKLPAQEMQRHKLESCPSRPTTCPDCQKKVPHHRLAAHRAGPCPGAAGGGGGGAPCPRGCGAAGLPPGGALLADHLRGACPRRAVACPRCGAEVAGGAAALAAHAGPGGPCPRRRAPCPRGCGRAVAAADAAAHLASHCPRRPVPCPQGCGEQVAEEDLPAHAAGACPRAVRACQCGARVRAADRRVHLSAACPSFKTTWSLVVVKVMKELGAAELGKRLKILYLSTPQAAVAGPGAALCALAAAGGDPAAAAAAGCHPAYWEEMATAAAACEADRFLLKKKKNGG